MTTIKIYAVYDFYGTPDEPKWVEARMEFDTPVEAREFAEPLKGVGMKGVPLHDRGMVRGVAKMNAKLAKDGANGGRNEAGINRYRKLVRLAAKLGIEIEWDVPSLNSYRTQAAFERAIAD